MRGMELDVALRKFLALFRLPGEAQKIERIVEVNVIIIILSYEPTTMRVLIYISQGENFPLNHFRCHSYDDRC